MTERKEYPRPQFRRESWQGLNGAWEFSFDDKNEGKARGWWKGDKKLGRKINVPFSYQYPASGINDKAVHDITWYRRTFVIDKENAGKRVLLCFNAADYETDVWVNGIHAVTHKGGFAPFSCDITDYLNGAENVLVVRCFDGLETAVPRGKQHWEGITYGCFYYPNSGIWQSVWLEFFGQDCIESYLLKADIDNRSVKGDIHTMYALADEAEIVLLFQGKVLQKQRFMLPRKRTRFTVDLSDNAFDFNGLLWSVENPNLISVDFTLYAKGKECDRAHTRLGLRKIHIDETGKICLNNKPLYQRLILDQGYWEESGLTPPSAEALKKDIELAKAMGFNGARKHQKFEDPYFYYYAEELGFLTWCEMPSALTFCEEEIAAVTKEWQEILSVAKNFTSNIVYVPLNESWGGARGRHRQSPARFCAELVLPYQEHRRRKAYFDERRLREREPHGYRIDSRLRNTKSRAVSRKIQRREIRRNVSAELAAVCRGKHIRGATRAVHGVRRHGAQSRAKERHLGL